MSSSGGSAAIREAIEARRAKIETPGESLKTLEQDRTRKRAWWNEKIRVAFLDDDGEPKIDCAWNVPRRLLTPAWLETMCLTCPMHTKIEYLKDRTTGDIVWPADAQMQCHPPPWSYAAVAVEEREVVDCSRDPCYYGDVRIMILNVPLKTNNDQTKVSCDDIRAWLLCGLQEEDEEVKEAREIVSTLEKEAKVVEHNLSRVGYMKFAAKTGFGKQTKVALTDEEQAAKREERHNALSDQRDKMEEDVAEARAILKRIEEQRQQTPVELERADVQSKYGTCTYYVSFTGYNGSQLEDIVCAKTDWPGIKLGTKHDDLPPWAGRGEIPDGSKSYIKRYTEHAVNMRGAKICRLQHGFGQLKVARLRKSAGGDLAGTPLRGKDGSPRSPAGSPPCSGHAPSKTFSTGATGSPVVVGNRQSSASPGARKAVGIGGGTTGEVDDVRNVRRKAEGADRGPGPTAAVPRPDVPFAGKAFKFHHGEYQEGLKCGFGIEFTDAGVYMGGYQGGRRNGQGSLQCADGDHMEGTFLAESRFPEVDGSSNPYKEGAPNGPFEIRFASGATYRGQMKDGRITGEGDYVSCLGERCSGDFVDGCLHGRGTAIDVVGQVWEGEWHEAGMDGEGRYSAPEAGEFEGDWVRGEWQGKGKLVFKGGNTYEGFFMDHGRSGPGMLYRGNVKSVYDPRSGRQSLKSNRVYEGTWRASGLRSGSMVRRKTVESLDFYWRYETLLRAEVEKKKARLYAKQARLANQDLVKDHACKLTADDLKAAHMARAINVEQIMRVTGKQLEAGIGSIARAADTLEQIAASRNALSNATVLSSLVQSRFQEAQDLQQLVNIADTAARAERLAHAQQAEMNYSA